MKTLIWTPIALKSLQETVDFLEIQWHSTVVDEFMDSLEQKLNLVQSNAALGPRIGTGEIRRMLVHPHISLFYQEEVSHIKLLLVWDNRQNPDMLFEKLVSF